MGFFGWMMNPAMLGLGALAVSLPIIIHLLNKRRFKIVTWAAMDFLLDAEKKNRRRVQLQHLILLLLRCLAMLLLGLLLARPLLPSSISKLLAEKEQIERVVLLDDSLSQQVLVDNLPAFQAAKNSILKLISDLAGNEDTINWITVYVTSNPDQPIISNEPITVGTLPNLNETLDRLECSDFSADYPAALEELNRYVSGRRENVSRVPYIFSDLRERDWLSKDAAQATGPPAKILEKVGQNITQGFVVDCGSPNDQNLAVVDIQSPDLLVANRIVRVAAQIVNLGTKTVSNFRVLMQIGEQAPIYETVQSLAPGQTETIVFRYLFKPRESEAASMQLAAEGATPRQDHRVRVEIDRSSLGESQLESDQLPNDNSRFLAARVMDNIPVLLVDGDPSPVSERSETHYLKFLDVFGTGLKNDTITVSELETISLANYRCLFLCNVDQISLDRVKTIEQWVKDGGSLVFLPGNQVRAETFNENFVREGAGLCPLELDAISGDPTMSSWVNFEVSQQVHPSLRTLLDSDANGLSRVNVFSWWTTTEPENNTDTKLTIPLRLNDASNSPAMVERSWGKGKVVLYSIPADGDWTTWPGITGAFVPVMLDLIDYLVGADENRSEVALGSPIEYPVDLSVYQNRVSLRDPRNDKIEAVARPIDESDDSKKNTLYRVQFDGTTRAGFFELGLTRTTGEQEITLFAANTPADESRLRRLDTSKLENDFWGKQFKLIGLADLNQQKIAGASTEFWPQIVWIILLILAAEQFLGYWFGRNQ
ncbi:MAG: BatA domain-containing protein [Pirellulaceae bacterium]